MIDLEEYSFAFDELSIATDTCRFDDCVKRVTSNGGASRRDSGVITVEVLGAMSNRISLLALSVYRLDFFLQ